jgi:hypothetical protein
MQSRLKQVTVDFEELSAAFEFVSSGGLSEHSAFVSIDTGKIYWVSDYLDESEEEMPDDIEMSDRYIAVPHANQLQLGRDLALAFIDQQLSRDCDTVVGFFRRKGAYRRFKDLLKARGMIQHWYDFEASATEKALRGWCEENCLQVADAS